METTKGMHPQRFLRRQGGASLSPQAAQRQVITHLVSLYLALPQLLVRAGSSIGQLYWAAPHAHADHASDMLIAAPETHACPCEFSHMHVAYNIVYLPEAHAHGHARMPLMSPLGSAVACVSLSFAWG